MFSMDLVGSGSVSFDTNPDSGSSHFFIRIWIQIQGNDTDSTDPDLPHCQSITAGGGEEAPAINPGRSARGLLDKEAALPLGRGSTADGLDKQSATTFFAPGMYWMFDVNSATKER